MATSSLFANIKITNPKQAEPFVNALEESANDTKRQPSKTVIRTLTDKTEIKKLMSKRFTIK